MRTRWFASPNQVIASVEAPTPPPIHEYFTKFPQVTISAQNCNSLNISTECDKQLTKLIAITALCTDIIFLSDLRLTKGSAQVEKIRKILACNNNKSYDLFFNSSMSKRGVGILLSRSLNYSIKSEYSDTSENILGLVLTIQDCTVKLCSVYGPNHNDKVFFENLARFLNNEYSVPVVIGGDWNTTYSTLDIPHNPDVVNMSSPPSITRSSWLADLCKRHDLLDPFRALHPTRRDFSFAPLGRRKNRSRLDFFLVSSSLISNLRKCDIAPIVSSSLFDHKSINLDFTRNKTKPKPYINRTITDNPRTSDVVLAAFADTYLAHADPVQPSEDPLHVHRAAPVDLLTPQKVIVGRFMQLIREYNDLTEQLAKCNTNHQLLSLLIAEKNTEIILQRELLWDIGRYQNLKLTCTDDFFFESLVSNIKGAVISFQTWVKKTENLKKSISVKRLIDLHRDFKINEDDIVKAETELNTLLDAELSAKVKSMKLFTCLNNEKPTPLFLNLAKTSNSGKSMSVIGKSDGTKYNTDVERNEGIVSFFENIYRKPADEPSDFSNCIENFLGHEIINNQIVNYQLNQQMFFIEPLW
jgi:exonuclease III